MSHQLDERGDPLTRTHEPDRKRFSAKEARQGLLGRPVLKVLGISLLLVFAVWAAVEFWGRSTAPTEPTADAPAASTSQTPTAEGTFDDNPPAGTATETVPVDRDPTPESGTGGESQQIRPDGTNP